MEERFIVSEIIDVDTFENLIERAKQSEVTFLPTSVKKSKGRHSKYAYLVHWEGYDDSERTWEPEENFEETHPVLKKFKKEKGLLEKREVISRRFEKSTWRMLKNSPKPPQSSPPSKSKQIVPSNKNRRSHVQVLEPAAVVEDVPIFESNMNYRAPVRAQSTFYNGTKKTTEEKRKETFNMIVRGTKYSIKPLFNNNWNPRNEDRTLIDDSIVEVFLRQYMYNELYDNQMRSDCHVFHTFFYIRLKSEFAKIGPPRRSELLDRYKRIFPKTDARPFLQKKLIVVPIHLDKPKHWFLALIHNPSGAIRYHTSPSAEIEENNNTSYCMNSDSRKRKMVTSRLTDYVQFQEATGCRILIMDSLYQQEKYKTLLSEAYKDVFECLRLWLQMSAASIGLELMCNRVRNVICENLPQQTNSVDCGIYMMVYAEYFTWFNTDWKEWDTDSLAHLIIDEKTTSFLESNEPRLRLEKLLQRMKTQSETL